MKKLQLFSALGLIISVLNSSVAYSAADEFHGGAAAAASASALVVRADHDAEGESAIAIPTEVPLALLPKLVLNFTDSTKAFTGLHAVFKGFDPATEEEKQSIDAALNRLAYDTIRPLLVDGPERLGLKTPEAIQKHIVQKLLSITIQIPINMALGRIPGVDKLQFLAKKIFPVEQRPQTYKRRAADTTAEWLMDRYASISEVIYNHTVGPVAKMPARTLAAYLTHEEGANIGSHLRLALASFADQFADARPYFARSWQSKLVEARNERDNLEARIERHRNELGDLLTVAEGEETLGDGIAAANAALEAARAEAAVMPEGFAAAEIAVTEAKAALETAIAEAERVAQETHTGLTGYFTYAASRVSRAIADPAEVAEARTNLRTAQERVAELQAEAEAAKAARIAEQEAALEPLLAKHDRIHALENNIRQSTAEIEEIDHEIRINENNVELFRGTTLLTDGFRGMDGFVYSKTNSHNDSLFRYDRAYYSALLSVGSGGNEAIELLLGRSIEGLGPTAYTEAKSALTYTGDRLIYHYNDINDDISDTIGSASRLATGQGSFIDALDLLATGLKAGAEVSQTMQGENPRAKEMYDGILDRTVETRKAATSLYETAIFVKQIGQTSIQALSLASMAYAAIYLADAAWFGEMGTYDGILGYMDSQRMYAMYKPADFIGVDPNLLYSALPIISTATMFLASSDEARHIAAQTAMIAAPIASLWFAPVLAPAVTVASVLSLDNWEITTRVASAGKKLVGGVLWGTYKVGYSYIESGYQTVRGWFA